MGIDEVSAQGVEVLDAVEENDAGAAVGEGGDEPAGFEQGPDEWRRGVELRLGGLRGAALGGREEEHAALVPVGGFECEVGRAGRERAAVDGEGGGSESGCRGGERDDGEAGEAHGVLV